MGKDSAARIELGRSFHQMGTVNEKVCESDYIYTVYIYIYIYIYILQKHINYYNYYTH